MQMMMMNLLRPAVFALCVVTALAGPASAQSTEFRSAEPVSRYELPPDGVYPEGIAVNRRSGTLYVGSVTTGAIYRGALENPALSLFLPAGADGRVSAVGLKIDRFGRLFIAGGATGKVWVHDSQSGALLFTFSAGFAPGTGFLNDLAITSQGDVYVTDSFSPTLWRIPAAALWRRAPASGTLEAIELGAPYQQQAGFNVNGIVPTVDGRFLLFVQSNTGKLFRMTLSTRAIVEVELRGGSQLNGDGLALFGNRLYAIARGVLVELRLSERYTRATILSQRVDPSFAFPTTLAIARGRALVVNSQFDRGGPAGPGTPVFPFTVSSIPLWDAVDEDD
jgi:sugar lactone lactonase YvrE